MAIGLVVVATGGTSDIPVAEEAAIVAESLAAGSNGSTTWGWPASTGSWPTRSVPQANCIVVVAGMEGALPSVVGGLVDVPVIAVPTSVGYGASFGGVTALLAMLNSCAPGVSVVNIDNGFGAAYQADMINKLAAGGAKGAGNVKRILYLDAFAGVSGDMFWGRFWTWGLTWRRSGRTWRASTWKGTRSGRQGNPSGARRDQVRCCGPEPGRNVDDIAVHDHGHGHHQENQHHDHHDGDGGHRHESRKHEHRSLGEIRRISGRAASLRRWQRTPSLSLRSSAGRKPQSMACRSTRSISTRLVLWTPSLYRGRLLGPTPS